MSVKIYHNPRCSKSRQALSILTEKGIEPEIIEYLNTPLNEAEIKELAKILGVENAPRDMMRVKEDDYKANNLKEADDEALYIAMSKFPKLIERPIVINKGRAVIARPPEKLLDII